MADELIKKKKKVTPAQILREMMAWRNPCAWFSEYNISQTFTMMIFCGKKGSQRRQNLHNCFPGDPGKDIKRHWRTKTSTNKCLLCEMVFVRTSGLLSFSLEQSPNLEVPCDRQDG